MLFGMIASGKFKTDYYTLEKAPLTDAVKKWSSLQIMRSMWQECF